MNKNVFNEVFVEELDRIVKIVNSGEYFRMGKLFSTKINNYYYDTGTGKIICLDDETYYIMNKWITSKNITTEGLINDKYIDKNSLIELLTIIKEENLIRAEKPNKLYTPSHYENLDEELNTNMEQLILELTGKCNLRCSYCVYNDEYIHQRAFNSKDLSKDIAKRAIDYIFDHSKEEIAITFYGGEPLLKYDQLKWCILYSIEKNKTYNKSLSFGFTTNVTMVNREIAQFFVSIPNLNILCSIDGSKNIHDLYRKTLDGRGSFDLAISGLRILSEIFKEKGKRFAINTVFAPPYTYEKLDEINDFFNSLSFLPKGTTFGLNYPTTGTVPDIEEWIEKIDSNPKYKDSLTGDVNPLWEWRRHKILNGYPLELGAKSIVTSDITQLFKTMDDRVVTNEPNAIYPFNACCVPGKRRIYVDVNGDYYPCERMGNSPTIGNVDEGIDVEKVRKFYVTDYSRSSINKCSNCWAIKMCQLCYAGRFDSNSFKGNESECIGTRLMVEKMLSFYQELLEGDRKSLNCFKDVIMR